MYKSFKRDRLVGGHGARGDGSKLDAQRKETEKTDERRKEKERGGRGVGVRAWPICRERVGSETKRRRRDEGAGYSNKIVLLGSSV